MLATTEWARSRGETSISFHAAIGARALACHALNGTPPNLNRILHDLESERSTCDATVLVSQLAESRHILHHHTRRIDHDAKATKPREST